MKNALYHSPRALRKYSTRVLGFCDKKELFPLTFRSSFMNRKKSGRMIHSFKSNFIPQVIDISAGQDIMIKIISFAQKGSQGICILSARGAISLVTLRQPGSSTSTITYEGLFQLVKLSGSYIPNDNDREGSQNSGMTIILARTDGQLLGGKVAGLLIAATSVQVVLGTFVPSIVESSSRLESLPTFVELDNATTD